MGKKKWLFAGAAALASVGAFASSASAFDCIRVSSSLKGLQGSTKSGNWLLFDLSTPEAVKATALRVAGETFTDEQAECVADAYAASGLSPYFALGVGVAGGRSGNGSGVLAESAPEKVLSNVRGIDHLEESPIGAALFGALGACGAG